tara:strand:+ start:1493 stop:2881 length:1389 start_codon:yes stop_codon:yes gene_type:complete
MSDDIPDFVQLSKIPVNYEMNLETDLLEPVIFNQGTDTSDGFARWTLQNKGFLHSHSKIFISVNPGAGVDSAYFNPATGCAQLVKKAVLKIGNKVLNELDSWDGLHAVKSSLIKNENNKEREQYTTGRFMNNGFRYTPGSVVSAPKYGLDNGYEYTSATPGGVERGNVPNWAEMDTDLPAQCPTFAIDLSDLFPFLKTHQLPLYIISEPINIELTFYPTVGKRLQVGDGDALLSPALINRNDLKFCADYIFYGSGDEMEQFANKNKNMSFSFVDYRLVESTISEASVRSGLIRNLGMANRVVPRVISCLADDSQTESTILSQANATASSPDNDAGNGVGVVKYNVRYNDRFEYTSDISNPARLFTMTTQAEGVPFLSRSEFSAQGNLITTEEFQRTGNTQTGGLDGRFQYLSTKLTGGRVGQRGLEIHLSGDYPAYVSVMRNYCEYLRVARLSDGHFEIFNA